MNNNAKDLSTFISPDARVCDSARVSGSARVYGSAWVSGSAVVSDGAWIYDRARVSGSARVYGSAWVSGSAVVRGQGDIASTRHVLTVGPVGSEGRTVTIHRHYDGPDSTRWGHLVVAGCWSGTLDELAERISPDGPHGWGEDAERWRADYGAVIAMARVRVAEWEAEPLTAADHERWEA